MNHMYFMRRDMGACISFFPRGLAQAALVRVMGKIIGSLSSRNDDKWFQGRTTVFLQGGGEGGDEKLSSANIFFKHIYLRKHFFHRHLLANNFFT